MGSYNKSAASDLQIKPGDFITSVNAVSNDTVRMAQEVVMNTNIVLTLKRPQEFTVELDKTASPGSSIGIGVDWISSGRSLLIKRIDDGLIKAWNEAHADREVRIGDRIISVNSTKGNPEKMLETCTSEKRIKFELVRP